MGSYQMVPVGTAFYPTRQVFAKLVTKILRSILSYGGPNCRKQTLKSFDQFCDNAPYPNIDRKKFVRSFMNTNQSQKFG